MIVLFTDFGLSGPYTGQVKAVLARQAPGVPVIDLFADLPAGEAQFAAYLLAAYARWFAPPVVFMAVVDPGVGSSRRAVVVEADERFYVGPENGLFELVLRRAGRVRVWEIVWRPEALSASFHGRDLFAPVAARLARGGPHAAILRPTEIARFPDWPDDLPAIVYVDRFGNAMTGLRASAVPSSAQIVVGGRALRHAATFSEVQPGEAFWYENANGLVELAVNRGSAHTLLGLAPGSPVEVVAR
jgi:S-adenosyl-L-methionine hydrolase (adenosine-forming)